MRSKFEIFLEKAWKIIKTILMIITAPVWYPWKLLFFRKEGKKFNQVDSSTKTFRILRSPITKTFKFSVFICIILLELLLVHKVRYSVITYPFTKNAVVDYYLNGNNLEISGLDESYKQSFQTAFDYIDTWKLDEKNKMHVILDSDFIKSSLKYTDNETISYILDKFNNDSVFRENFRKFVKNINSTISKFFNEIPAEDLDKLNNFLSPIVMVSSWAIDYAGALEIGGSVFDWAKDKYNISEKSLKVIPENIEKAIKTGLDFSNGSSLQNVLNYWK